MGLYLVFSEDGGGWEEVKKRRSGLWWWSLYSSLYSVRLGARDVGLYVKVPLMCM